MNPTKQEHDATTQAAFWQAKLSSDLVTQAQKHNFKQWLAKNQENQQAWQEVSLFWNQLDTLSSEDILTPQNMLAIKPVATAKKLSPSLHPNNPTLLSQHRFAKQALAMAASILLMVTLLIPQLPALLADHHTAPGEMRIVTLSDGSILTLNTDTTVSVDYSTKQRLITLHNGEAYFAVATDSHRPFIVKTNYGRIRALGTEFDIKSRTEVIKVTVFEHAVNVSLDNGQIMTSLQEGQQLSFNRHKITQPGKANLSRTQSWRNQHIVFLDKPLAEVLAELSHYRSGSIIIINDAIKSLAVTGIFDTRDTNIALKTIEQSLPIKISKITEKLVLVSAK